MTSYRLFGSELSPYSVKVRSYLRYKGLPSTWIPRGPDSASEFDRHAKLPLIPLLVLPDGRALQDSTPIIEALERDHGEPSISLPDATADFASVLIEEYADEWVNKPMFHYRWFYPEDAQSAAERIVATSMPSLTGDTARQAVQGVMQRMVPRLPLVGSSPECASIIEASLARLLAHLERHLAPRAYLFGGRPALADFGLFAQLYECLTDPIPGRLLRQDGPAVVRWIDRMLTPVAVGPFEPWDVLEATLLPLIDQEVFGVFLPWSMANARALAANDPKLSVALPGGAFRQAPQKYHARSLLELQRKLERLPAGHPFRARFTPII